MAERSDRGRAVLTVAGSDPSGAAGLQMDLRAFASLGLHGCSVVTAVTVQSTASVGEILPVPPALVRAQLDALTEDLGVRHVKTGMLYNASIAGAVADWAVEEDLSPVVDPVLASTAGPRLSSLDLAQVLRERLIPRAQLVTPNLPEAAELTGIEIRGIEDMKRAAEELLGLGCGSVLVKGGHVPGAEVVDVFYDGRFSLLRAPRVERRTRGTGCMLSALATGLIAQGAPVREAVELAKRRVTDAIRFASELGRGPAVGDPLVELRNMAERYSVLEEVQRWSAFLEEQLPVSLVPEVGVNLAYALPFASSPQDVCAVEGRLVRAGTRVRRAGAPAFGASRHTASVVLAAMSRDRKARSALNLRYTRELVELCRELGLKVGSFDRSLEPRGSRSTMEWGTGAAIDALGFVPDAIYDEGGHGKEPMIRLLGRSPADVVDKVRRIVAATRGEG
ncbi:MAG: bifunctional hydroxymethylpyrimidine kinase/phosphomethylpyrimidine kinase [Thermoplasmatota archaeon]